MKRSVCSLVVVLTFSSFSAYANESEKETRNKTIDATLITSHYNNDCRSALRDIAKDAETASFLRTASTAAHSVGATN